MDTKPIEVVKVVNQHTFLELVLAVALGVAGGGLVLVFIAAAMA